MCDEDLVNDLAESEDGNKRFDESRDRFDRILGHRYAELGGECHRNAGEDERNDEECVECLPAAPSELDLDELVQRGYDEASNPRSQLFCSHDPHLLSLFSFKRLHLGSLLVPQMLLESQNRKRQQLRSRCLAEWQVDCTHPRVRSDLVLSFSTRSIPCRSDLSL